MSKLTQWLPGMYVMLADFEDDYDLAVVEDWMRDVDSDFDGVVEDEDCLGCLRGMYDYWDYNSRQFKIKLNPAQALEIVRNSKKVK